MNAEERDELLKILIRDYNYYKTQHKVWQREQSSDYYMALGKLNGFCMALKLDIVEDINSISIQTRDKKKVIIKLQDYVWDSNTDTIKPKKEVTEDAKGIVDMGRFLSYEEAKRFHESCIKD